MSAESAPARPEHVLKDFEGTYIGISPTDESDVGMGEFAVVIDGQGVRSRMATGLEIQEDHFGFEGVRELSEAEVVALFEDGADVPETRAFEADNLTFMFITDEDPAAPILWITGSMGDLLGPTVLFSPTQIEQGAHEAAFRQIEEGYEMPGALPRLNNNGLAPGVENQA
jgi:hypothetical protein